MKIVVIASESLKDELLATAVAGQPAIVWLTAITELSAHPDAAILIDLLFEEEPGHAAVLKQAETQPVIISSVCNTLNGLPGNFIRINGWPTFLKRDIVEAAGNENQRKQVEAVFSLFGKKTTWVPDSEGFISARVLAMMINEAYLALEEGVSTKEEIDTAMKSGTNYPLGPFEWASRIGLSNICALLQHKSKKEKKYTPAALLVKEASQ
jgi:3-hydroxybutyryl-CoA dehydrogenase